MTEAPYPPMLDHALAAARRGIRVFPCVPKTKRPQIKDNLRLATTDEAILRAWWSEWPDANPAGVFDLVIDVDVKDGKRGAEGMADLDALDLLPATYTQRSPTGGWHFFYAAPGAEVANSVGKIRPGVDVRGHHGFVLLAGAQRPDGSYEVASSAPIVEAPAELVRLCGERRKRGATEREEDYFSDRPDDVARAVAYLRRAKTAVAFQGGHNLTIQTIRNVRDYGIRAENCVDLMLEHWNPRCEPEWKPEELEHKVHTAYEGCLLPAGNSLAEMQFDDVSGLVAPEAQEGRGVQPHIVFERIKDLRTLPPTKWLIHRWVPEGGIGIFYGKWASGKSFILMDLGLHLAHGLQTWHGARLPGKPCDVLILAREGHQGFVKRVDAFKRKHGILDDAERLTFMRTSVSLMRTADFNALCHAIRNDERRFKLVVIDTIARAMPGADMNEQQNVTQLMERCQQLGELTGAAVICVHHQNKGGSMLGSVFFEANSDFVFEVTRTGAETGPLSAGEILCTKMKDGEDRWRKSVAYERIQLPIADIEDGDASSLAVASISDMARAPAGASIEDTVAAALARKMLDGEALRTMPFNKLIQEMSAAEREAVGANVKEHKSRKLIEAFDGETERVTNFGILTLDSGKGHGRGGAVVTLRRSANGLAH